MLSANVLPHGFEGKVKVKPALTLANAIRHPAFRLVALSHAAVHFVVKAAKANPAMRERSVCYHVGKDDCAEVIEMS